MNKPRLMKRPEREMRKLRDRRKKLQGGCKKNKKIKEKLLRKQLRKQKKQLRKKKKKRKGSWMRSFKSKKLKC